MKNSPYIRANNVLCLHTRHSTWQIYKSVNRPENKLLPAQSRKLTPVACCGGRETGRHACRILYLQQAPL